MDLGTLTREPALALRMNDIGAVSLHLLRPIAVDLYGENRNTGALILIDAETNRTVAAGMVTAAFDHMAGGEEGEAAAWGRVTAGEREARWGHRGGLLRLTGPIKMIDAIERSLFAVGAATSRIDASRIEAAEETFLLHPGLLDLVTDLEAQNGLLALVVRANEDGALTAQAEGREITLDADDTMHAVAAVHEFLRDTGIFISTEMADL